MNYKAPFYTLLTVFIISLLSIWAYYIISYDQKRLDNNSLKITFDAGASCGPSQFERIKMERTFKNYNLNSDTIHNLKILSAVKKDLNFLKHINDSIHGIKISFTNDTPYKTI
jgi:hypothetical protein